MARILKYDEMRQKITKEVIERLDREHLNILDKVSEQQETLLSYVAQTKNVLERLVIVLEEIRPKEQIIEKKLTTKETEAYNQAMCELNVKENGGYDWWQLANGQYAKVPRINLTGEVFLEDGTPNQVKLTWNPYSNRCNEQKAFNMMKRKSGDSPKGWPEWTK